MSKTKLFIGGLNRNATEDEMRDHFGKFGEIRQIQIRNGFGFVDYADERDAEDAMNKYNGTDFLGQRISIEWSTSSRKDGGVGPRNGGDRFGGPPPRGGDRYDRFPRDDRYGGPRDDRYGAPPRDDRYGGYPPRDDRYGPPRGGDRYGGPPPRGGDRYGGPPGGDRYERRDDRYGPPRGGDRYGGRDDRYSRDRPTSGSGGRYGKPHSSNFRFQVSGFPPGGNWQDLKDFFRKEGYNPTYTVMLNPEAGEGSVHMATQEELDQAFEKLNGSEYQGKKITLVKEDRSSYDRDQPMGDAYQNGNSESAPPAPVSAGAGEERGRSASPKRENKFGW